MTILLPLNKGMFTLIDEEDYDRLKQWHWFVVPCGRNGSHFYAGRNIHTGDQVKHIAMAREIMQPPADKTVDHWNRCTLDNRRSNLRIASASENSVNRIGLPTLSGFRGVGITKHGKFRVKIKVTGTWMHGGTYSDVHDAARRYDELAIKFFGEFAVLNFPVPQIPVALTITERTAA